MDIQLQSTDNNLHQLCQTLKPKHYHKTINPMTHLKVFHEVFFEKWLSKENFQMCYTHR